jgi:hydroxymethylglutaryl-CoA lyase
MTPIEQVEIVEVGPRDGLQNLPFYVETEKKVQLIRLLAQSGIKAMETTSFVHPKAIPQFRDAAETVAGVKGTPGLKIVALVPNLLGAQRALAAGVQELSFVFSVSLSHNRNNVNKTPEESLEELKRIFDLPGMETQWTLRVNLATAFGCPFEGILPDDLVYEYTDRVVRIGAKVIALADTVGYGNPAQVRRIVAVSLRQYPDRHFLIHLHNTRGLGLANALAAYEAGLRTFDSSIGGLGGCPYAPGATGNISTEDLVFMFESMGVKTGIRFPQLFRASNYLREILPGVEFSSGVLKAGLPKGMFDGAV